MGGGVTHTNIRLIQQKPCWDSGTGLDNSWEDKPKLIGFSQN